MKSASTVALWLGLASLVASVSFAQHATRQATQGNAASAAQSPVLAIKSGAGTLSLRSVDLLARPDVETISFVDVSAYPREKVTFRAIKMGALLKGVAIPPGSEVQFVASDGFGTSLKSDLLLNTGAGAAIAYLAIEDPKAKWPLQRNKTHSAGPFYLFWVHPELSGIGREQYPYLIDHIEITTPTAVRFPKILPEASLGPNDPVRRGYASFEKNCLTCHTMNGQGTGSIGPDLNMPMSPTEYFQPGILRRIIRNSQSVRANPNTPMGPFPPELIPDPELDDLIAYMTHMAKRRGGAPVASAGEDVRSVVTRSLMSWQTGDRAAFAATADPKLVFAFPGRRTDAAGALKVFDKWQAEYKDIKVYIHQITVEGDRFAAEYQFANTPLNGPRTVTGTVAVGRVQNGRITLLKEYLDGRVSRAQEAGAMPLDEGSEPFPWPPIDLKQVNFPPMERVRKR